MVKYAAQPVQAVTEVQFMQLAEHGVQTVGVTAKLQKKAGYSWQVELHPSLELVFPSSQTSGVTTTPSPHILTQVLFTTE